MLRKRWLVSPSFSLPSEHLESVTNYDMIPTEVVIRSAEDIADIGKKVVMGRRYTFNLFYYSGLFAGTQRLVYLVHMNHGSFNGVSPYPQMCVYEVFQNVGEDGHTHYKLTNYIVSAGYLLTGVNANGYVTDVTSAYHVERLTSEIESLLSTLSYSGVAGLSTHSDAVVSESGDSVSMHGFTVVPAGGGPRMWRHAEDVVIDV